MAIPGPFPARGPDRRTVTDRAGAGLAMRGHGQDARATSELTLKGAVEEGLEEVVQAADVAWPSPARSRHEVRTVGR